MKKHGKINLCEYKGFTNKDIILIKRYGNK